jgi:cytoskeleton protein RodZ
MPDNAKQDELAHAGSRVASKSSALGLGERLRSARKARALSLEHVAEALHLDENIVLALEDERFDVLGAPVFVRGHLKAYSRLVGLSTESVLEAFNEKHGLPEVVPTTGRQTDRSVTVNPVLWSFWALVILLAFGLGIYLLLGDDSTAPKSEPAASSTEPQTDLDLTALVLTDDLPVVSTQVEEKNREQAVVIPAAEVASMPEADIDDSQTPAESETQQGADVLPEPTPVAADQSIRLSLHFLEESWVEISDANRRLAFGLQRQGRRRELTGEPPFDLLLGNAKGIELRLNDKPYNIPITALSGKVARFSITRAQIE